MAAKKMTKLREFTCIVGKLSIKQVRELIQSTLQPELRSLIFHELHVETELNCLHLFYRRKLLQAMLMQRSYLQRSYFGEQVLEFAEHNEEDPSEYCGQCDIGEENYLDWMYWEEFEE